MLYNVFAVPSVLDILPREVAVLVNLKSPLTRKNFFWTFNKAGSVSPHETDS